MLGSHIPNARQNGSGSANLETDAELQCTSEKIQPVGGNAGAHVDLHEQHDTGMLFESAGNSGAIDGLGKSPGRRSAYSCLQQLCGRLETLCDRKRSAETTSISHPAHERDFDGATGTRFNPLKSTCATPTKQMEKEVQRTAEQFGMKIEQDEKNGQIKT